jgi:1-acyl-sn-glycerol-3-phosphate acyltransferase
MSAVRLCLRSLALVAWTSGVFLACGLGAPLAILGGAPWRWRARVQRFWSRGVCRIVGVRLVVDGRAPGDPCLLVSNHVSYLDVVVLGALVPCSFVAKHELARWPVLGLLAWAMGTQFVVRENKRTLSGLNERLRARLERGETMVLFPEGTSTSGEGVLPFRPALLAPAITLGRPVSYAALRYVTPRGERPATEVVCWWGGMTFVPHMLALLQLPWIEASVRFGSEPITADDRKQLAARLHEAVVRRLQPAHTDAADCRSHSIPLRGRAGALQSDFGVGPPTRANWNEACAPRAG